VVLVHAYIEVTELPDGIKVYCDGLGLTLKRRLSPTWVELAGANLPIYLLANRPTLAELGSKQVVRSYERHWTHRAAEGAVGLGGDQLYRDPGLGREGAN
jgi:hypothetical protein